MHVRHVPRAAPWLIRLAPLAALALAAAGCAGPAGPTAAPVEPPPTRAGQTATTLAEPVAPVEPPPTRAGQTATAPAEPVAPPADYWPTQGWRASPPEAQGMDGQRLADMVEAVRERKLNLHSLLVVRHGYLVSETYFTPQAERTPTEIYSCTKSVIATLIGIALEEGSIQALDRPVVEFFPERAIEHMDARKAGMTLEDVLTMRTGLDWEESDPTFSEMWGSPDWVKFVLDTPMREEPGSRFNYCTGCSHVLSAVIQAQTGMTAREFAGPALFEPLGIAEPAWQADRMGISLGGWGLKLAPRDMAKLGYLYLRGGEWEGRQIVPAGWVAEATRAHTDTDSREGLGYGYQWWTYPDYGAYAALGRDGQTIFVVPGLDLVVVTTAKTDGHGAIFDLIEDYAIPAATGQIDTRP
jgi:CubicO group peptidase (beta-lactamase class C family)